MGEGKFLLLRKELEKLGEGVLIKIKQNTLTRFSKFQSELRKTASPMRERQIQLPYFAGEGILF